MPIHNTRVRFATLVAIAATAIAVVRAGTQAPILRTPDGHPDLQGTYDLGTLTPLERAAGTPAILSQDQATKLEQQTARLMQLGSLPSRGDRAAPPVGGDGSKGPAGNVGGYNLFWLDPGAHFTTIAGQKRASIVIDPPDGRIPPVASELQKRREAMREYQLALLQATDICKNKMAGCQGGKYGPPYWPS